MQPLNLKIKSKKHLSFRLKFPAEKIEEFNDKKLKMVKSFKFIQLKPDGSKKIRELHNPNTIYKSILRKINKNLFNESKFPDGICGSIPGKTLLDMVEIHCGKEAVYKIDIKDFFPNIKIQKVLKLFLKLKCSNEISNILANFTTYNDTLPLGFPTSPMIANMIAYELDIQHLEIAKKFALVRTRWVDDIIFSGRIKDIQKAIPAINSVILKNGFIINHKKTEFLIRKQGPTVTGLVINKHRPYVPNTVINKIEEMLLFAINRGIVNLIQVYQAEFNNKNPKASLNGRITWLNKYNPNDSKRLKNLFNEIKWN